ncbi:MAG: ECF sigma factor [Alphaproteobacteria bacterium ADurb.BinA280]|jgi:RNA polymerase sigma factor (TIGR02999 family)|nr:sigma-70 family RNA polymerase sigma factor [Xanthomonadales bacterium]OPZ13690.1 MAG: ECF sigma factor [Alphaproteobacteria bacterium ADurb.BinA280]
MDLTVLINRARSGDVTAADSALREVYEQLKRIALSAMHGQSGQTLSATALVNEAYLRLLPGQSAPIEDRQHFYRLAARAMRQILIDQARRRSADKRGGDWVQTELNEQIGGVDGFADVLAIDQALVQLEALDPELAQLTEQYFFAGLNFAQIAELRGISERTVRRDWDTARAFLRRVLAESPL